MKKRSLLLVLLLFVTLSSFAGAVEDFVKSEVLKQSYLGVCVVDIASGEVVAESGSDKFLTPASTMKLVTSAAALRLLGSDYRYSTKVYIDGEIDDKGVLHGAVRIVGSGDPTLGSKEFANQPVFVDCIIAALKSRGVNKIKGSVTTDESVFSKPNYPLEVVIDDIAYDYGAGSFGINFCDNIFPISLDFTGRFAKLKNLNSLVDIAFENNVSIKDSIEGGGAGSFSLVRGVDSNLINVIGEVARDTIVNIEYCSTPNPAKLLRDSVLLALSNNGIEFKNSNSNFAPSSELLLDYKSPELSEILQSLLVRSDNMYAESVLRTIAVNAGLEGSINNGVKVVRAYWKNAGLNTDALIMCDGSGLTRNNKVHARFLADLLINMQKNDDSKTPFSTLIPIAGMNGTVKSLLKDADCTGKFALKSGSMGGVQCFAGYYPASSPQYAVVILANFYSCTRKELREKIEQLLIGIGKEVKIN